MSKVELIDAETIYTYGPMIEYAPVKHAYWIHEHLPSTSGGTYAVIRCSECTRQFQMWETKYCPHGGSRMAKENRK